MRKFMNIIAESPMGKIFKSTYTEWKDRDGIYLVHPGSNSIYVGFSSQQEAEDFAAELNSTDKLNAHWHVLRLGKFKTMSDEEAMADHEVRHARIMQGLWVPPLSEATEVEAAEDYEETPEELAKMDRVNRIEKGVKAFCEKEIGWTFYNTGYPVIFDSDSNEISISPDDEEASLEQLEKLKIMGDHIMISGANQYQLRITITAHQGIDIPA